MEDLETTLYFLTSLLRFYLLLLLCIYFHKKNNELTKTNKNQEDIENLINELKIKSKENQKILNEIIDEKKIFTQSINELKKIEDVNSTKEKLIVTLINQLEELKSKKTTKTKETLKKDTKTATKKEKEVKKKNTKITNKAKKETKEKNEKEVKNESVNKLEEVTKIYNTKYINLSNPTYSNYVTNRCYVFEYKNENDFRKKERSVRKYNMLAYKKLTFEYYPKLRNGEFLGELVNKKKNISMYELVLPTDKMFVKVHGEIRLHYTVFEDKNIILLTNITPEGILEDGHKAELTTYKGVMISKANPEKDMFKINLLNMMQNK